MGVLIFYTGDGRIAGDVAADDWRQIRRQLPYLIDLLNGEMRKKHATSPPAALLTEPLRLETLLNDESKTTEEVNLLDRREWRRFLAWCDHLLPEVQSLRFYREAIQLLKDQSRHPDE